MYDELTDLALCAVAARNRSNALPTIAWGYAVYYLGICVGAQTGLLVTARLGGAERTIDLTDARCKELVTSLGLTPREADVFRLLARGNNTLRIQDELGITKNTLKYHVRHIYEKAGVHSQQELIDLL